VLLVIGKTIKRYFTQCSDNCPHQHNWLDNSNTDLSLHTNSELNPQFFSTEIYLGKKIELSYPKVDDLVGIIKEKGPDCLIFKKDL
jgi:hypothetical protein